MIKDTNSLRPEMRPSSWASIKDKVVGLDPNVFIRTGVLGVRRLEGFPGEDIRHTTYHTWTTSTSHCILILPPTSSAAPQTLAKKSRLSPAKTFYASNMSQEFLTIHSDGLLLLI